MGRYKMKYSEWDTKYKTERIRCSRCGSYILFDDIDSKKAYYVMVTPDSDYSFEEWEGCCRKCNKEVVR